jgi:hypothetical protein
VPGVVVMPPGGPEDASSSRPGIIFGTAQGANAVGAPARDATGAESDLERLTKRVHPDFLCCPRVRTPWACRPQLDAVLSGAAARGRASATATGRDANSGTGRSKPLASVARLANGIFERRRTRDRAPRLACTVPIPFPRGRLGLPRRSAGGTGQAMPESCELGHSPLPKPAHAPQGFATESPEEPEKIAPQLFLCQALRKELCFGGRARLAPAARAPSGPARRAGRSPSRTNGFDAETAGPRRKPLP